MYLWNATCRLCKGKHVILSQYVRGSVSAVRVVRSSRVFLTATRVVADHARHGLVLTISPSLTACYIQTSRKRILNDTNTSCVDSTFWHPYEEDPSEWNLTLQWEATSANSEIGFRKWTPHTDPSPQSPQMIGVTYLQSSSMHRSVQWCDRVVTTSQKRV